VTPHAAAWFEDFGTHSLQRSEPHLALLKLYDVRVVKLISADPGLIVEDE